MIPVKSTITPKASTAKFGINKSVTPKSVDKFATKKAALENKPDSQKSNSKEEESKVRVIDDDEEMAEPNKVSEAKKPENNQKSSEDKNEKQNS